VAGSQSIESLVRAFMVFPGIGRRSAERMVYYLMGDPAARIQTLTEALSNVASRVHRCPVCNNFAEGELCVICSSPRRDTKTVCVVAEARDLEAIEAAGGFHGVYHVLGGLLSPLDGVGPKQLQMDGLHARISASKPNEVVIALSATVEGEATAAYLHERLSPLGVRITRLARGVPAGGSLEYLDPRTLSQAVRGREEM
jgi:recombination protein RecR